MKKFVFIGFVILLSLFSLFYYTTYLKVDLKPLVFNETFVKTETAINEKELEVLFFFRELCDNNIDSLENINVIYCKNQLITTNDFESIDFSLIKDNVKEIDLSDNLIKTIPKNIFGFTNLEKLNLSKNSLSYVPKELSLLKNLKEINFSDNEILGFAVRPDTLNKLSYVNISNNKLTYDLSLKEGITLVKTNSIRQEIVLDYEKINDIEIVKAKDFDFNPLKIKTFEIEEVVENELEDFNSFKLVTLKKIEKEEEENRNLNSILKKEEKDINVDLTARMASIEEEEKRINDKLKEIEVEEKKAVNTLYEEETSLAQLRLKIETRKETFKKEEEFFKEIKRRN